MTDREYYDSKRWKNLRAWVLRRDAYQCQLSKRYGKMIQADMVHHIFPRHEFPEYQWEKWNLISLSNEMHNSLHDRNSNSLTEEGMKLLVRTAQKQGIGVEEEHTMKTLVIGLSGTGKSTYVKNHLTQDSIAYDLDAIASAFRLRQPHEEYHSGSRRMANDLLFSFAENASDYASDIFIIRTAPQIEELERIRPDRVVWCKHRYGERPSYDEASAEQRLSEVVAWCEENGIQIRIPPS